MKTVNSKMTFKTVTSKQAEQNPALASLVGKKRDELQFSVGIPDSCQDIEEEKLQALIADFVVDYAKRQITANAADWDYAPTPENANFDIAWQDYISVTQRERTLTKETLASFSAYYVLHAPAVLGLTERQAAMAGKVITDYNKQALDIAEAMLKRLTQFAEKVGDNEQALDAMAADDTIPAVLNALTSYYHKQVSEGEQVTADAL